MNEENTQTQGSTAPETAATPEMETTQTPVEPVADPIAEPVVQDSTGAPAVSTGIIVIVIIGALVAAAGFYFYFQSGGENMMLPGSEQSAAGAQEYPEVVAVVNGEEISNADFIMGINQVAQGAAAQGADPSDPAVMTQIEAQALEVLINTTVLAQAARASEVTVEDAAVDAELAQLEGQYEDADAFAAAVAGLGMTMEGVREDVRERQLIDAYLASEVDTSDVAVSEAEVQEAYDSLVNSSPGVELPALEEVYAPLEQQLLSQKQQVLVSDFIGSLREGAEIDVKI